jgi:prolyl-tRNA synthetase
MDDFVEYFTVADPDKPQMHGGFASCHWAGSNEDEEKLAKDYKVTIRCIPNGKEFIEEGKCILTGKPSSQRVIFAKAY